MESLTLTKRQLQEWYNQRYSAPLGDNAESVYDAGRQASASDEVNESGLFGLLDKYGRTKQILDVGCGDGRYLIPFAEKGFSVTGIDSSESAIKRFKEIAKRKGLEDNVHTLNADIRDFPLPQNKYDLILCRLVLQQLTRQDIPKVIKNLKKGTTFGGFNSISLPGFTQRKLPNNSLLRWEGETNYSDEEVVNMLTDNYCDFIPFDTHTTKPSDWKVRVYQDISIDAGITRQDISHSYSFLHIPGLPEFTKEFKTYEINEHIFHLLAQRLRPLAGG